MGMGLPTHAVVDEETEARTNPNFAAACIDSANGEDDPALSLDAKAEKALECPCVADLVKGPCGKEFSKAFRCFIKSQEPAKGSDCVEPFEKMQQCMIDNANEFSSTVGVAYPLASGFEGGHRLPTRRNEEKEEESKPEINDVEVPGLGYRERGLDPPEVPERSIRLPPWYRARTLSENGSRKSK